MRAFVASLSSDGYTDSDLQCRSYKRGHFRVEWADFVDISKNREVQSSLFPMDFIFVSRRVFMDSIFGSTGFSM